MTPSKTPMYNRRMRSIRALSAVALLVGCSGSKRSQASRADAVTADAAIISVDAGVAKLHALGPMEWVRERFDRECPRSMPEPESRSTIGRRIGHGFWACGYRLKDFQPQARADVTRYVALLASMTGEPNLRNIEVQYQWETGAVPAVCAGVVDEVVSYFHDATRYDEATVGRLRAAMRAHEGSLASWYAVEIEDVEVLFMVGRDPKNICLARIETDRTVKLHVPVMPVPLPEGSR